jgi:hypothetical protein
MKNNEAAFPSSPYLGRYDPEWGLTKRELIAAMAMQGLLSDPEESGVYATVADVAVKYADALIARLAADPVAEGVNLLPMYSRELDEGLGNDQDRGVSR